MSLDSGLYEGTIRHRRKRTAAHDFYYRIGLIYADIDEIQNFCRPSKLWSFNKNNIGSYHSDDYLKHYQGSMREKIAQVFSEQNLELPQGKVFQLCNWRYFAYIINPICCYFCYDEQEQLQYIVAEVTNTPWGQSQNYILKCDPTQAVQRLKFDKDMHVSPFFDLQMFYTMICNKPDNNLSMHIINQTDKEHCFDATLNLKRKPMSQRNMNFFLLRYPMQTIKIVLAIYYQALRLWLKGVPYIANPHNTRR